MSWDVVIFNLNQKIDNVEDINEDVLVDIGSWTDFRNIVTQTFTDIKWDDTWGKVERPEYSIEFSIGNSNETVSNTIFHLYGEKAIYALIDLCKRNNWQAFDTGLGEMLDLEHPERNGYEDFQKFLDSVMK